MKRFLGLIIFLIQFIPLKAQIKFGPKLGFFPYKLIYHTTDYRSAFDSKIKFGLLAGGSFDMPVSKSLNLRIDPAYTLKGRRIYIKDNGWTLNEIHHFIEMPIQLLLQREGKVIKIGPFSQIGPFDWYIGVGPNISYFLGGQGVLETQVLKNPYKITFNDQHEGDIGYVTFSGVNRFMWGLDFSLGIVSTMANKNEIVTDLKFNYGHSNIGKYNGSDAPILGFEDNLAASYRMLTLSVSYWYSYDFSSLKKGKSTSDESGKSGKPAPPPRKKEKNINRFKSNKPVRNSSRHPKNINKIKY